MVFEIDAHSQCFTCLSIGRKMLQIGALCSETFRILVPENCFQAVTSLENMKLCWECYSLLRKATKFRYQVQKAKEILQNGQSSIYGTLSSLTTVIKNDAQPHTIYVNENNIRIKEENDATIKDYSESVRVCSPLQDDNSENELISPETESNVISKCEIKNEIKEYLVNNITKSSKWALKRAIQNRKPKFKIVKAKDIKVDVLFKKEKKCKLKHTRCFNCGLRFENDTELIKHHRSVHRKEFFCEVCNAMFSNKVQFSSHTIKHGWKYQCTLCSYICSNEMSCRKHLMKSHRQVFECLKCVMMFVTRREFFQHYKDWHEKFVCDYCGISFKMRYCIKDHIRKQHSPIQCVPCNKRFARYNGLWLHNKLRHGPPAATAYCVECDKSYPDIYRYKWHLANSTKHKPKKKVRIPCPECDKVFSKNIYMKDHYNLVHLKQYKYRCEDCDKNYIRNADLLKHRRRVHEGILPPKNKICYICGRGFSTNKILSNHLRTHTGERPFACAACPARFAQRTALVGHVRALHHDGERNLKT